MYMSHQFLKSNLFFSMVRQNDILSLGFPITWLWASRCGHIPLTLEPLAPCCFWRRYPSSAPRPRRSSISYPLPISTAAYRRFSKSKTYPAIQAATIELLSAMTTRMRNICSSGSLSPPISCIRSPKITGIKLCQALRKQYGFDSISLKPANLYGLGDNAHPNPRYLLAANIHTEKQLDISRVEKLE